MLHPEALQTAKARQVLPHREGSGSPALGIFALIVKLVLVFTVPAAFVEWFGEALPERFREFAKLAVLVLLLVSPLQRIFGRLLALSR